MIWNKDWRIYKLIEQFIASLEELWLRIFLIDTGSHWYGSHWYGSHDNRLSSLVITFSLRVSSVTEEKVPMSEVSQIWMVTHACDTSTRAHTHTHTRDQGQWWDCYWSGWWKRLLNTWIKWLMLRKELWLPQDAGSLHCTAMASLTYSICLLLK